MNASPFRIFGSVFLGVFAFLVVKTPLQGALGFLGFQFGENQGLALISNSSQYYSTITLTTVVSSSSSWFIDSSTMTTPSAPQSTYGSSQSSTMTMPTPPSSTPENPQVSSTMVTNSSTTTEYTTSSFTQATSAPSSTSPAGSTTTLASPETTHATLPPLSDVACKSPELKRADGFCISAPESTQVCDTEEATDTTVTPVTI